MLSFPGGEYRPAVSRLRGRQSNAPWRGRTGLKSCAPRAPARHSSRAMIELTPAPDLLLPRRRIPHPRSPHRTGESGGGRGAVRGVVPRPVRDGALSRRMELAGGSRSAGPDAPDLQWLEIGLHGGEPGAAAPRSAGSWRRLAGWPGARLAQDNVIWKPPGAKALGFHQDDSYTKWMVPAHMVTCWIALDPTSASGGTIEYVRGSHKWPVSPPIKQFHAPDDYRREMREAAAVGRPRRAGAGADRGAGGRLASSMTAAPGMARM